MLVSLTLAGCSTPGDAAPPERNIGPVAAGEIAPNSLEGVHLAFASSGGVYQEGIEQAIWEPFMEASGAVIAQDAFDLGKLQAMVEGGSVSWDIVHNSAVDTGAQCGTLLQELDLDLIDTSQVPEDLEIQECGVPAPYLGYVVAYNTELFGDNPPTSAADFFDLKKFPGNRGVAQTSWADYPIIEFAMVAEGEDPADLAVSDMAPALDKFAGLGDKLVGWTTGAQAQQQLESGEVAMSLVWTSRGYGAALAGAPVAPMWQDSFMSVDYLGIPKGVKDPEAAHLAINYLLGAKQQEEMVPLNGMAPVNKDAAPVVDDLLSTWLVSDHADLARNANIDFWVEHQDELNSAWAGWVTGMS